MSTEQPPLEDVELEAAPGDDVDLFATNPLTPYLGIRTPDGNEAPNVPLWLKNLADDVDKWFGPWVAFVPVLTGVTLGTGGTVVGRYSKVGRRVTMSFLITLGTGGAFTGTVTIGLATASAGSFGSQAMAVGVGMAFIGSTFTPLTASPASGTAVLLRTPAGAGVGAGVPAAWVAGAQLSGNLTYESAT